jgi:gas vesicle protein
MPHNNVNSLVGFPTGVMTGAVVALLYALKTGRETWRYTQRNAHKGRAAVVEIGREVYEAGHRVANQAADLLKRCRKLVAHR